MRVLLYRLFAVLFTGGAALGIYALVGYPSSIRHQVVVILPGAILLQCYLEYLQRYQTRKQ